MAGRWFLLKQFLRHPIQVGAIAPSGERLCRELVDWLELENVAVAAELGPGTGVVTREAVRQCGNNTRFFAVELDKNIYDEFKTAMPGVEIFNANACELDKLCQNEGIEALDAVISGLPWASFPEKLQQNILSAVVRSLKPGGKFSTFAYLQGMIMPGGIRFRKLLEKEFAQVELSPVIWKNLPPAVVYRCIKK